MNTKLRWLLPLLFILGCDAGGGDAALALDGGLTHDGGKQDGPGGDAASPDAAEPDAASPDGDAALSDAASPDGAVPNGDAATPDAALPDAALPEPCPTEALTVPMRREGRRVTVDAFPAPAEGLRARRVVVYLPADYDARPDARYDVLYLHDGQNVFDPETAFGGAAWEVDDAADALALSGAISPLILVAVDNTEDRMSEYTPSVDPTIGEGGQAAAYADLLVERIKPWVETHFRVQCGRAHAGVAGSSLGGLINVYLKRRHPEAFGRVAALSPSLWWNDREASLGVDELLAGWREGDRLWLDAGSAEGNDSGTAEGDRLDPDGDAMAYMAADARALAHALRAGGLRYGQDLALYEVEGAAHNERAWAARTRDWLLFLFADQPAAAAQLNRIWLYGPVTVGGQAAFAVDATLRGGRLSWLAPELSLNVVPPERAQPQADGRLVGLSEGPGALLVQAGGQSARLDFVVSTDALVGFTVDAPWGTPEDGPLYLAGDLPQVGGWDPAGLALAPQGEGHFYGEVRLPMGATLAYKITRGSWETVEKTADGGERADRTLTVVGPAQVSLTVERWADWQ